MNVHAAEATVRHSIVVEAPIERAFKVFTEDFGKFKPKEHNMLAVPIVETVFEPRVGGHIYDRGADGSECRWARVLAYEPPHRVLLTWDISPRWQIEASPPRRRTEPAWSSSTGNWSAMAKGGRACVMVWPPIKAGRSTCSGTPTCSAIRTDRYFGKISRLVRCPHGQRSIVLRTIGVTCATK